MKEDKITEDPYVRITKPTIGNIAAWIIDNDPGFKTIQYKTTSGQKIVAESRKYGYFLEKRSMSFDEAKKCFKVDKWKSFLNRFQYAKVNTSGWKDSELYDCYVVFYGGFNHFITIYK